MLSSTERAALQQQWLAEITAEIERREAAKYEGAGGHERERFMAELALMGERLCSGPDYVPLTPQQQAQEWRDLVRLFRERGYPF
jgi:hypothetical protein